MKLVKGFITPSSILKALEKMLEYPFEERPLVFIKFNDNRDACYTEGTLHFIDKTVGRPMVLIENSYENKREYIRLHLIGELHISDVRAE